MTMVILHVPYHPTIHSSSFQETKQSTKLFITSSSSLVAQSKSEKSCSTRRSLLSTSIITSIISPSSIFFTFSDDACFSATLATTKNDATTTKFYELPNSGGVKSLDLRLGTGFTPIDGDQVTIHYYGRLAAKQGWRFDSTYDHKDSTGEPIPFVFILGSNKVISGIEAAVRSMKVGGVRRVIIPPSQGYQNTTQEPLPPNIFDRQRLFTTIFNPTRLANGEGSTLGTLIFDIELVNIRN